MQNFLNKQELVVPTADVATNVFAMDVIGNKSDTAAGTSIVGLSKAIKAKTDLIPADPADASDIAAAFAVTDGKIDVIDAFHDVPAADSANNTVIRDVIGNKTDGISGNSLYAYTKYNNGSPVSKQLTISGNGATQTNVFTFVGTIEITKVIAVCTAVTNSTTFSTCYFNAYDGTNTVDVTLNTGVDLSGITQGSIVRKNGDSTAAAVYSKSDQVRAIINGDPSLILNAKSGATNYIRFAFTGDADTSVGMMFVVQYRPLSVTGAIAAV